ncbi:hypothetical protein GDO81_028180 [Engystomops pustulosus]|uniref:Uncharacterized protein n=1 Tax=Engystomops pustulosus TaxID=76066 RepID=A0AAV6YP90_ENGPU|nr:hypothetical protein GDO81_028180 [Engystomops pustulosus]
MFVKELYTKNIKRSRAEFGQKEYQLKADFTRAESALANFPSEDNRKRVMLAREALHKFMVEKAQHRAFFQAQDSFVEGSKSGRHLANKIQNYNGKMSITALRKGEGGVTRELSEIL